MVSPRFCKQKKLRMLGSFGATAQACYRSKQENASDYLKLIIDKVNKHAKNELPHFLSSKMLDLTQLCF